MDPVAEALPPKWNPEEKTNTTVHTWRELTDLHVFLPWANQRAEGPGQIPYGKMVHSLKCSSELLEWWVFSEWFSEALTIFWQTDQFTCLLFSVDQIKQPKEIAKFRMKKNDAFHEWFSGPPWLFFADSDQFKYFFLRWPKQRAKEDSQFHMKDGSILWNVSVFLNVSQMPSLFFCRLCNMAFTDESFHPKERIKHWEKYIWGGLYLWWQKLGGDGTIKRLIKRKDGATINGP